MFKDLKPSQSFLVLVVFAVFLAACALPSPNQISTPTGQVTPESVYTQAVQTVIAQLTKAAVSPAAIQPTSAPSSTEPAPSPSPLLPTTAQTATSTPPPPASSTPPVTAAPPTATPEPSSTPPSTDPKLSLGDPTFQDKFSSDKNWALAADKHSDMYIMDDQLFMKAFNPDRFDSWALTWPKITNFYIEMTAKTETCSGLDHYGLMLRAKQDATTGYLFGLSCDGQFSFRKWDGTRYTKFVDWTKNSAIIKGSNKTNRLGIKAEGNHFTLYANGEELTDLRDNSYNSGFFGVFIGAAETVNFTTAVSEMDYWELP